MKTNLRSKLLILGMVFLPGLTMAQKQFGQLKVRQKSTLNLREASMHSNTSAEFRQVNPSVVEKMNLRMNLPKDEFISPLLSKKLSSMMTEQSEESNVSYFTEKTEIVSPNPDATFKGSKEAKNLYPPDPDGAAGPDYIMQTNNKEYVVYDKTGAVILSLSPDDFWSGFAGQTKAVSFPNIEYDPILNHFYILTLATDLTTNDDAVLFAASETSDPTGNWFLYSLDLGAGFIQNAPQIGYSKRWFTFTTQQYDTASPNNFNSSSVYLMSVADFAAGNLSQVYFLNDSNFFSMSPVETLDTNINNHFLISNLGSSDDTGYLFVVHIGGPKIAPTYSYDGYVTKALNWSTTPSYGHQLGTTDSIYLGNTKLTGAVYRNGQIWTTHTIYLPAKKKTKTSAIQWWQINASTLAPVQVGRVVNNPGKIKYGFPSIAVSNANTVFLGFSYFSATKYPSAAYSLRYASDPQNSIQSPKVYKKGKASYSDGVSDGVTFDWGRTSGTCVDPSTPQQFWTLQEYAESPADKWGTWWATIDVTSNFQKTTVPLPVAQNISAIVISPNPANSVASISWKQDNAAKIKIQVTNTQGNVLLVKEFSAQKGANKMPLNISNLVSGVYSVTLVNGINVAKAQLVVE